MAVVTLVSACGGSSGSNAASPSAATVPAGLTAFFGCLKSHGFTPPPGFAQRVARANNGGPPDTGGPPPTIQGETPSTLSPSQRQAAQQALQACQLLAPAGTRFGFGGGGRFASQIRAYASCLSDHGYTKLQAALPPPTTQPAGGAPPAGPGSRLRQALTAIDRSDPAFVSADAACHALAPNFTGGITTTTPATGG